jgi:Cofilin/tropomyosin-type actin-binding protein
LACGGDTDAAERAAVRARQEASGRHGFKASESTQFEWKEEETAVAALKAILNEEVQFTWALFGQADGALNQIDVLYRGSSGFDDLKQYLSEENVRYGVIALQTDEFSGGDQEGVYAITRHLFFSWVGDAVKPLEKARSSQHRVALYQFCKKVLQLHGELQATTLGEFSLDRALASVTGERGIVH